MSIRCLIIDDEPIARSIMEKYVAKTPGLKLEASLDNAIAAIAYLQEQSADLIFLDINMPEFSGIDLLKSMHNPPQVIITTAYSEYGAESYEYEVVDYLLKPIPFDRFLKAIQKVKPVTSDSKANDHKEERAFLFLKEEHQTHKIDLSQIRYVQAYGNYLKVFCEDKMLMVRKTIQEMEAETTGSLIRIHKSYLLSLAHMKSVSGNEISMDQGEVLPIGKVYRKAFEAAIS